MPEDLIRPLERLLPPWIEKPEPTLGQVLAGAYAAWVERQQEQGQVLQPMPPTPEDLEDL